MADYNFFNTIFNKKDEYFLPYFRKYFLRSGSDRMRLAKCFSLYNDVEEYLEKYGDEDPRTHNKITEWGLCVCNNANNKDIVNRVQSCLIDASESKADPIQNCESELINMDNVVNIEVAKFRMEFEGSVAKITTSCNDEAAKYGTSIQNYGIDDDRTISSAIKLSKCAAATFCKSAVDDLARCANTNQGNLDNCHDKLESMIKCVVDKIHQPMYDFATALRNQSRSYEPLPPQKKPTCNLNKKNNNKHD